MRVCGGLLTVHSTGDEIEVNDDDRGVVDSNRGARSADRR